MNRLTTLLFAALITVSLTFGSVAVWPPDAVTAQSSGTLTNPRVQAENAPIFSGAAAFEHVDALSSQIGSRVAGAPAQAQTHQYLLSQFQAMGYQTELQSFPITAYQDRGSTLALISRGGTITVNTVQYSSGGSAEAALVEAGLGRSEEMEAAGVAGKIALVNRGDTRFVDKANAAANAGAVGVIIVNNQPGNFNGSLIGMSTIPVIAAAQEDGPTLRQTARTGGTVRITVDASVNQSSGSNVVATKPGGPQTLVIGGHIDSVAAGPGANDNGSGAAVVLELARVMAARQTPFTLKFVGFDAEEIGLIGSAYYVNQLTDREKRSIVGMINLDMVGVGGESRVGGTDSMVRLAQAAARQSGLQLSQMGESGASDHASFTRVGIPALFIYRSTDPNYHSPNDKTQYIDPANLQIAGQLALDVVSALERGE